MYACCPLFCFSNTNESSVYRGLLRLCDVRRCTCTCVVMVIYCRYLNVIKLFVNFDLVRVCNLLNRLAIAYVGARSTGLWLRVFYIVARLGWATGRRGQPRLNFQLQLRAIYTKFVNCLSYFVKIFVYFVTLTSACASTRLSRVSNASAQVELHSKPYTYFLHATKHELYDTYRNSRQGGAVSAWLQVSVLCCVIHRWRQR